MKDFRSLKTTQNYNKFCQYFRPDKSDFRRKKKKLEAPFESIEGLIRFSSHRSIIEFVAGYEEITSASRKTYASYGVVNNLQDLEMNDSIDLSDDDFDFENWNPNASDTVGPSFHLQKMGPAGYMSEAAVFELLMPRQQALGIIGPQIDAQIEQREIQTLAITLQAAIQLAVSMEFEVEDGDFTITHLIDDKFIHWFVYGASFGSPVAEMVYQDFNAGVQGALWQKVVDVLTKSTCCHSYCDRCILLPRTPEFVLRQKFLNKAVFRSWRQCDV